MRLRPATTALGLSVALLTALCCLSIYAQSGRRKKAPPPVAPVPTPTPEATPEPTPKKDENAIVILVAPGEQDTFANLYPFSFNEAATAGCADRLTRQSSAVVDLSRQTMTRGEAIAKAKAGKSYVVLITLVEDRMSASSSRDVELEVDYVVFAPGTAKVKASGRTYEYIQRKGPLVVGRRGRGVNLPSYREQMLRRAGEDAADRILKALHLDRLPTPPGK
jgi:hypothetical protein